MVQRSTVMVSFVASLGVGVAIGVLSRDALAVADSPTPCKATSFSVTEVEALCKSGGVREVKKRMKEVVEKAKSSGKDVNCRTCHETTKEFEKHRSGSVNQLKQLL